MHREGMVTFFKSPALVVSILLAILGAFLWQGYPEKALVAFIWIPIFLLCCLMHSVMHSRHPHGSSHG
jgi:hypothetical protein